MEKISDLIDVLFMEKTALNAQEARAMAARAGLFPEGQWRWALRNLRDSRGDLLQGKEMADAKLSLGAMNNNSYQKLKRMEEVQGHGTVPKSGKVPGTEFIGSVYTGNDKFKGATYAVSPGPRGESRAGGLRDALTDRNKRVWGKARHSFHTHPSSGRLYYLNQIKNWRAQETSELFDYAKKRLNREDSTLLGKIRGKMGLSVMDDAAYEKTIREGRKQINRKYQINHSRFNHTLRNPLLAYPSGYSKRTQLGKLSDPDLNLFQDIKSHFTDGDIGAYRLRAVLNKDNQNSILVPSLDIEGIHKIRPQGMRSIYLDRQPRMMRKETSETIQGAEKLSSTRWAREYIRAADNYTVALPGSLEQKRFANQAEGIYDAVRRYTRRHLGVKQQELYELKKRGGSLALRNDDLSKSNAEMLSKKMRAPGNKSTLMNALHGKVKKEK